MKRWMCTICGYVYDPKIGDPDHGIEPGTEFKEVDKDWICPICAANKDEFDDDLKIRNGD